jgi:IS5 family transposase
MRRRARVEHPLTPLRYALRAACGCLSRCARLHIIKNLFKHRKVRYRGLRKNTAQLHILFALANLVMARRALLGVA